MAAVEPIETTSCAIVGGGPAGMMLGLLLARAGVNVAVLEKHQDFLRDFRGDTIHPSTIELMEELGLLEELERLPHQVVDRLGADVNGRWLEVADFSALNGRHRSIYMIPQWDFLELLARKAKERPSFRLEMDAEVTGVWKEDGRIVGVVYRQGGETKRLRAELTVACDGRSSRIRQELGVHPVELGAPIDVLWFRVPRVPHDPVKTFMVVRPGGMLGFINRGSYWQLGYFILKGDHTRLREEGLVAFRTRLAEMAPFLDDGRLNGLSDWSRDIPMLRVQVNHLKRWSLPGVIFLGDAAHAMSPIGGVGINLAIQDAVAAANLLSEPLLRGSVTSLDLVRVQLRRSIPALVTQAIQIAAHRQFHRILDGETVRPPAWLPRVLSPRPIRTVLARAVGFGLLPEHWRRATAV